MTLSRRPRDSAKVLAEGSPTGPVWTTAIAVVVFIGALALVAVDRVRLQRRLAAVERSEALLETELADARRQLEELRRCLGPDVRAGVQLPAVAGGESPAAAL